ncbi:hypothetical protein JR316_0005336 [Psilocybe cubensis]|uniref:Uncharacterized protein n=2 Tax=Psilocybe cubensis TaxID=181762 RepID=A0ACB8H6B3_PSICU|nr:hypothetical protein JR316_0005336 [Psilocybe cubensis]KAH9483232.1 hypothetical protein JR316_0005336 [Psilocybe cubensis]
MVLDGVADAEDHYGVERRGTSLIDTDKVFDAFLTGCAGAGPENCQFWAPTADDIRQNLTVIMKHIRSHPMPIKADSAYGILDYKKLRRTIFSTLFSPYTYFSALAKALSELAAGNGTAIYTLVPSRKTPECHCDSQSRTPKNDIIADAPTTIICNDGEEIQEDIDALEAHLQLTMKASQWGDFWASIRFGCLGWPKFPTTQFRGPFEGKTSHPILMIGNTADPVTPLSSARKMAQGFEGSVVLQQNSLGHCSLAAPSPCTYRHVRNYFVDGILPPEGTVCEPDVELFPVADSLQGHISTEAQQYLDSQPTHLQGREFVQAVVGLSKLDIATVFF